MPKSFKRYVWEVGNVIVAVLVVTDEDADATAIEVLNAHALETSRRRVFDNGGPVQYRFREETLS